MSLFDWMFRRTRKPASEPIVDPNAAPPPPPRVTDVPPFPTPPAPPEPAKRRGAKQEEQAAPTADPYSADDFLPISRQEILEAGKGGRLLRNMWFGRRDLIPPASDPRTKIIDRALVSHGFLTPEELAEIHRIGDEMEKARPTIDNIHLKAGLAGEAAVKAYREAKKKLKEKKKKEAAARKKQREA
ncbi:MAG TPA: RNA-directed DNA polymerase, partial [Gemmataceae bacterium]|nr:RNA-directed DNA polymerase [Gemmataceae bacterium]